MPAADRTESGIPGLDKIIEGGFVKNSINLIAGQTGTGKTLFAMQYPLHGLRNGESGLYITLEQTVDDIMSDVGKFGWDVEFKKYIQQNQELKKPKDEALLSHTIYRKVILKQKILTKPQIEQAISEGILHEISFSGEIYFEQQEIKNCLQYFFDK